MSKQELCCAVLLLCAGSLLEAQVADRAPRIAGSASPRWLDERGNPWSVKPVAPVQLENSSRIESLLRAGNLYLSLQDAIALALENNLDIEVQRFETAMAQTDVLRAKGGGTVRGIPVTVTQAPAGVGGPASPLLNSALSGLLGAGSIPANISTLAVTPGASTTVGIAVPSFSGGPALPSYDPALVGSVNAVHQSTPQANAIISGTNVLLARNIVNTIGLQQGFSTGTQIGASFNATNQNTNAIRTAFNPYTNSALGLTITQPLLRGLSLGVNRRYLRIAKNNEKIADLVFRQQAIDTVAGVIRLYYDLVSLSEDVKVKQQTLALAEKLYEDNKLQVEQGTLAPIELVRAQAQVAASRQDLANSDGFLREQELILKTVLSRRGTADPLLRAARVVPTTPIPEPAPQPVRPVQDLLAEALRNRPDVLSAALQLDNSGISLEGSRNNLLPEIDLVGTFQNAGLAGAINPLAVASPGTVVAAPNPAFLGGFGTTLGQIFRRNYPTYGVGLQLTLPLRNRVAQADVVRDELQLRQVQAKRQQLENQVRLEVEDSLIALERTRAAYEAAVQTRILQQQSLEAEQEKYAVGLSTTFLLVQYQSFLAQARSTEVAARGAYAKAQTALERNLAQTLEQNGITIEEAYHGRVSRAPSPVPPVAPASAP